MTPFIGFFIVTLAGILSSTLSKKLHVPWVAALVLGGIILGPNGLRIFELNDTVEFLAEMGLIFLMFMAGLETRISAIKKTHSGLFLLAFLNGFIPFLVGVLIAYYFGYGIQTMLLLGTVFVSSSIAVVIPTLEKNDLLKYKIGVSVLVTSVIQDVASLIMVSLLLQSTEQISNLPLVIFYPLLFTSLLLVRYLIPKMQKIFDSFKGTEDRFQQELRITFLVLIATVLVFQLLGLHPIIGGFMAGLALSDSLNDEILMGKLRALSYGVFVPTFFIVVGIKAGIPSIHNMGLVLSLTTVVVLGSLISKVVSGTLGAKLVKFTWPQSLFFGVSSIPQLSTTLAVAYTGREFGLLSDELYTALVVLSVLSTLIGPTLMSSFKKDDLTPSTVEKIKMLFN